jgi:hypothetical protein
VLWRTDDDRKAIRVFSGIFCQCVHAGGSPADADRLVDLAFTGPRQPTAS